MARDPKHDVLFEPLQIGPKTLRNRFYQVPHSNGFGSHKPEHQAAFRGMRAEGGWAAVNVEISSIDPETDRNAVPTPARLWDDDDRANLARVCEEAHRHGALVGLELWAMGAHAELSPSRVVPGAPSQLPSDAYPLMYPRELDHGGIREIVGLYGAAARRAAEAGFDIIYAYGAHGYLPTQFLSPFYNKRTDQYGGSLENRARFWLEVIEAVRGAVDGQCAVAVRLGIDPRGFAGVSLEDALGFVRLADDGVDLWDVNTSLIGEPWVDMRPSRYGPQGYQVEWSGSIRSATRKPIVGVSRLTSPDRMAEIVRSGVWDLVGGARPAISDPFLPRKVEEGRYDEIRECIGCNVCISRARVVDHIACTQNATAGEEYRRGWHPERFDRAENADRDVLVVGGGAAGMECAIVLAKRGFRRVHLVEASPDLGGVAGLVASMPGLGEWRRVIDWRRIQLSKLRNVEVITGVELDAEGAREYGAEIVVAATGSRWVVDGTNPFTHEPIPGAEHATAPEAALLAEPTAGERAVVYDCEGYLWGAGLAERYAAAGAHVRLVTPLTMVAPFLVNTLENQFARERLDELGVGTETDAFVTEIGAGGCRVVRFGQEREEPADRVILVTARRSRDALYRALRDDPGEVEAVYAVGDCVAPRQLADAIFDGHRLAREIDSPDPMRPLPYLRERRLVSQVSEASVSGPGRYSSPIAPS